MITPDYYLTLAEGSEAISENLHNEIIKRVVENITARIGDGKDYVLTAKDKYMLEVLEDSGMLREDIEKEIAKLTKIQLKEIKKAFEEAGIESYKMDSPVYEAMGIKADNITESPYLIRLLQRGFEATSGDWQNYTRTFADEAQRLFIQECDKAYNLVSTGAVSYTEAFTDAIKNICADGVTVTYPSGHKDTIETATLRCIRTGVAQSCGEITLARMKENNVDLVLTSSHIGARPTHQLWQGRVFRVNWDTLGMYIYKEGETIPQQDGKYPDFVTSTRYGYVDGLCGANCRHSFMPYIEGYTQNPFETYDNEENRKIYELSQRQRTLERRIRKTKRECIGYNTAYKNAEGEAKEAIYRTYQKKSALLQKQNTAYNEFCNSNGLTRYEDRVKIAEWNRSESAQARAAAKKMGG